MSKNKETLFDDPGFIKMVSFFLIFCIIFLWILSVLTRDTSLLGDIKVAVYVFIFCEAIIFIRNYFEKLKIEAENERYREEERLRIVQEFEREKAQGGKIGTTTLFGRQQSKEEQGRAKRGR